MVDASALRTNQTFIIGGLLLAFLLGASAGGGWIALAVGAVLALGTLDPRLALFQQVYFRALRPAGLVKPVIRRESASPHRFAQGLGGVFSLASGVVVLLTGSVAGWVLAWIVIVLAGVTLFAGFCLGCFVYLHLDRWGLLPKAMSDRARRGPGAV
ncbi:MAG: DUF4395 domain-containing protein [Actinobacteria bacterium]|nr:DUF4395 domain-containing protein [Actinomycetota bacterium]